MVIPVSSRTCGDWDTSTISYSSLGEFCMLPGIYFIKEAGTISTEAFYSKVMQTASIELIVVAIGLIIFLIGGVIWFKMWEGRKSY